MKNKNKEGIIYLLLKKSKSQKTKIGFSLIEILVVISIFAIIATVASTNLNGKKQKIILEQAQASVVQAFEEARSKAATGFGEEKHGVHVEQTKVIVFEGDSYVPGTGNEIALPSSVLTDQTDMTIIFTRISAEPDTDKDEPIIITHTNGETKTIILTEDGKIIQQ